MQAINSHSFRCEEIPLEAALSFPIPLVDGEHRKVGFFYYSIGGPITNRLVGPPTYRVSADVGKIERIEFVPVTPQEMGIDVSPDTALEKIELEPRKEGAESYDNLVSQLCASFDRIIEIYPKPVKSLSEIEEQDICTYQSLFNKMAKHSLIPAYIALNPHFFTWLNSVTVN
jgi:hypothetical protein